MTDWQRDQHIADIGDIRVHASRWPGYPGGKPPRVMWNRDGRYEYLPPHLARQLAAALIKAADEIETDPTTPTTTGGPP